MGIMPVGDVFLFRLNKAARTYRIFFPQETHPLLCALLLPYCLSPCLRHSAGTSDIGSDRVIYVLNINILSRKLFVFSFQKRKQCLF